MIIWFETISVLARAEWWFFNCTLRIGLWNDLNRQRLRIMHIVQFIHRIIPLMTWDSCSFRYSFILFHDAVKLTHILITSLFPTPVQFFLDLHFALQPLFKIFSLYSRRFLLHTVTLIIHLCCHGQHCCICWLS